MCFYKISLHVLEKKPGLLNTVVVSELALYLSQVKWQLFSTSTSINMLPREAKLEKCVKPFLLHHKMS